MDSLEKYRVQSHQTEYPTQRHTYSIHKSHIRYSNKTSFPPSYVIPRENLHFHLPSNSSLAYTPISILTRKYNSYHLSFTK
jgi:hypothetical protein